MTDRERAIEEWKHAGLESLRTAYDLTEQAVVVDAGGYLGQWTSDVFSRFLCTVHVYEPVPEYADRIRERFARNPRIRVHERGLAGTSRDAHVAVRGAGSHIVKGVEGPKVRLVRASEALEELGAVELDLLKLNVEGAEYEILDELLASNAVLRIRHLQVQFHDTVPGWRERTAALRSRLAVTHDVEWRKELVWESWRLRSS